MRVGNWKLFFLFINQNISCGYSNEQSKWDGSFEHPKHMFKFMGKEINAILGAQTILIWTYAWMCSWTRYRLRYRAYLYKQERETDNKKSWLAG